MQRLRLGLGGGDRLLRLGDCAVDLGAVPRVLLQLLVVGADALAGKVDVEPAQPVPELLALLRLAHLALQGADLALHLAQDVLLAQEVLLGLLDLAERLLAVGLELGDAGRLLEHGAAVLGTRGEHRVNLALGHHRIGAGADARAHEEVLHVLEARGLLVDVVLAGAVAVDAAGDGDLVVVGAELLLALGEGDGHFRRAERLARVGAVEDHVGELGAPQRSRLLLAENPADRVGNIGLSASVRTDDRDQTGIEVEPRLVRERLEADYL